MIGWIVLAIVFLAFRPYLGVILFYGLILWVSHLYFDKGWFVIINTITGLICINAVTQISKELKIQKSQYYED